MTRTARHLATAAFAASLFLAVLPARAAGPEVRDVTPLFLRAAPVDSLKVVEVGGILVMRGRVAEKAQAEAAGLYAQSLGYARIANLIQVTGPVDDAAIERRAERELALHRSLDGCRITIDSNDGVVHIAGQVRHELQKDVAIQLVRNVDGVREVRSDLRRF